MSIDKVLNAKHHQQMATRQVLLLEYLREVARDLLKRGIIRQRRGDDFLEILKQEPSVLVSSIFRDLNDAGFSLKSELVGGAVDAAKEWLGDFLFGQKR